MMIRLFVTTVALALMVVSRPISAYSVTIQLTEPVDEKAKTTATAFVDTSTVLPGCAVPLTLPCVLSAGSSEVEHASVNLLFPPTPSLPAGTTAMAVLLQNVQPRGPISDIVTLRVLQSDSNLAVNADFRSETEPTNVFPNAPNGFTFGILESGGPLDVTRNLFTGPLADPTAQKQLFPPATVPVLPFTIMAQSDLTVSEPEPSTQLLFASGAAAWVGILAWRKHRRR
jgi:hypothetical protein